MVAGRVVSLGDGGGTNRFLDKLSYAAGAVWSVDAVSAISRKARDIRGRLADAVRQVPFDSRSAVHIGLETLDGAMVEIERFRRIVKSVLNFDLGGKDVRWIYCHQFQSYAPPDEVWVIDETVHKFASQSSGFVEPLRNTSAVVPKDVDSLEGVHWLREPP